MSKNSIIDQQEDNRDFGTNPRRVVGILTSVFEDTLHRGFKELWMNPEVYGIVYIQPRAIRRFIPIDNSWKQTIDKYGFVEKRKEEGKNVPSNKDEGKKGSNVDGL